MPLDPAQRHQIEQDAITADWEAERLADTGTEPDAAHSAPTGATAVPGALKKKLGLDVTSEKVDGRGRCYKTPAT